MPTLHVQIQAHNPIALDMAFDCEPGELVALVGPSGSGKTSALRAIAGLLCCPSLVGFVRLGNTLWFDSAKGIHLPPQARHAGLVFQSYALFPHLDAINNVAIYAHSMRAGAEKNQQLAMALDLFARVGLAGLEQRFPAQLSGGQQQRVALARALMRVVDGQGVLLLDEPFSAVDAPTRQVLYRELAQLRRVVSAPMVLVTHDLHEARRLADRVVVVDGGSSLQSGAPHKVFSQPRNARVARLVGIQNLFEGHFYKAQEGWARLSWDNVSLHTVDKNRIADGEKVSWVLAGESLQVLPLPRALEEGRDHAYTNLLECVVQDLMELGETCLCTLTIKGVEHDQLTLTQTTAHVRAIGGVVGGNLMVRIAPQAIHIMPLRSG